MKRTTLTLLALLTLHCFAYAQRSMEQDSTLNNLVHEEGYQTDPTPSLGSFKKLGRGDQSMILIPGLGFGEDIFNDFMEAYKNDYSMYAVTLAGMGNTAAPAMPEGEMVSYAQLAWQNIAQQDILKLIEAEKLNKPILVGHFINGPQIAFELARMHPDLIGGVIILGGEPFRYFENQANPGKMITPRGRAIAVDQYLAANWFKTVTKKTWDDNMFLAEHYSNDLSTGQALWDESASVSLPVLIRYLCEFFAYDLLQHMNDYKTPTLVLIPSFTEEILNDEASAFIKTYYVDSWDYLREIKNPNIRFETVADSRLFVWKDQPKVTYDLIKSFVKGL